MSMMMQLNLSPPLLRGGFQASSQAQVPLCYSGQTSSSSFGCPQRPLMGTNFSRLTTWVRSVSKKQEVTLASTPLPQSPRPLWPIRIPRPLVYSTNLADVDPVQLSELWAKTLPGYERPQEDHESSTAQLHGIRPAKAIYQALVAARLNNFTTFVIVLAEHANNDLGTISISKVVGIGRAVSDGAFIATICDVAVDPEYQKQGIGRRIVKRLVQEIKKKGGPTGFAVFPPPLARRFFWLIGFRSDRKYRLMGYRTKEEKPTAPPPISENGFQTIDSEET